MLVIAGLQGLSKMLCQWETVKRKGCSTWVVRSGREMVGAG